MNPLAAKLHPVPKAVFAVFLGLCCGLPGCGGPADATQAVGLSVAELPPLPPPDDGAAFTDVTEASGIHSRHRLPHPELRNIVEAVGAGAAFADLDGDDWLDLLVLGGARSPDDPAPGKDSEAHARLTLYRNTGDGRFQDVTRQSGIETELGAVAVAVGDVDGDGLRDLYLVDRGANRLYRNRGELRFEDVTRRAEVGDKGFGVAATFLDIDGDGDLDLYVANYLEYDPQERSFFAPEGFPGPLSYRPQGDRLYRNRGDGTFDDITRESGVAQHVGRGMSLAAWDFDDDGDSDLFVANDATANFLLVNDGDGNFSEEGYMAGLALGENGEQTSAMASDVGDINGDGQLDLAVSDTAFGALYRRSRPGLFEDVGMYSGIGVACAQYVSWGQNLLDFDNDGDLDLFVANGGLHHLVGWEDLLLRNDGSGRFEDASADGGPYFATRRVGRSSIAGDYDNDGDVDLFVTTLQGKHHLLRNDENGGAWLSLDLVGLGVRDPLGARVELTSGHRTWVSESRVPSNYLGQSDPRLHFGLGDVEQLDSLRVRWNDGSESELRDVPVRQILKVRQGDGA
jgi:hypothetical protein